MKALCCTACGELVIKSNGDDTKIRSKVIIINNDNTAIAVCKGCGIDIPIPLSIDTNMMKSIGSSTKLRIFVKS